MIIYRPHMELLDDAMKEAKEFETIDDMKNYIVKYHTDERFGEMISYEDISLGYKVFIDNRIGWRDSRYVLIDRYGHEDFIKMYGAPQAIGFCATDYEKR